jgi:hypothetical protein
MTAIIENAQKHTQNTWNVRMDAFSVIRALRSSSIKSSTLRYARYRSTMPITNAIIKINGVKDSTEYQKTARRASATNPIVR